MEDIFHWIRKGDAIKVRMWLDDTEHDMNQGYISYLLLYLNVFNQSIPNCIMKHNSQSYTLT